MDKYRQILSQYWGYSKFRPLQEDIIRSVVEGNDTLALMPTGGGKSITFQVPAMATEGICIVVTPLIALMKDQVENLKARQIKALAIYSGMDRGEIDVALDNAIYGNYKFLYCSPERLATEIFRARVQKMKVNLIAIDEAHCISQWGYDFRPSYIKITEFRQLLPNVPILALTATATSEVVDDIQEKLSFKKKNVFRKSFERKNISYIVREVDDKQKYMLKIFQTSKGSGIVYVRNRKRTKELALVLMQNGISADYYHAGLSDHMRHEKQNNWKTGKTRVIVSTNAFGMGIDKADVRAVVHIDLPDSLEAYYQEAGRAGRDEKQAYAVLLYNTNDKLSIHQRIAVSFPDLALVKKVYNALANFFQIPYGGGKFMSYDFDLIAFITQYKFNVQTAFNSLKILEQEGYISVTDELNIPSKVHFLVSRDDLYKFQVENAIFDSFIKLLLRSYEGMFSDYVSIDEGVLARRANTNVDTVYKYLQKLSKTNILNYIPRREKPVVVYTEERLDESSIRFSYANFNFRKERYIAKAEAMLEYASSHHKCRSQLLLAYFGEVDTYRCGQCDVCQQRNELGLSKYEFDIISEQFKKELHDKAQPIDKLIDSTHQTLNIDTEKIIKVSQWLIDNEKLKSEDGVCWEWKH